jgi:molybdenum cofactor biosynthesis protein B
MSDKKTNDREFRPLNIAVLTVSDSRTPENDKSGNTLVERVNTAGHRVHDKQIVRDDVYAIRAVVSAWINEPQINAIITTGGTGITGRDGTPEAVSVLLDKEVPGFGERFRAISWQQIGTSTMQSRALSGVANRTFVFVLPGSTGACITAWDELISQQLDYRTRPCNLVELMPRLDEK